jgi:hypothetical protein
MSNLWGYVDTLTGGSHKAHLFHENGRSACGRWLALGEPRPLIDQEPKVKAKHHCSLCWLRQPPEGACCYKEKRTMNGGCKTCGAPSL